MQGKARLGRINKGSSQGKQGISLACRINDTFSLPSAITKTHLQKQTSDLETEKCVTPKGTGADNWLSGDTLKPFTKESLETRRHKAQERGTGGSGEAVVLFNSNI